MDATFSFLDYLSAHGYTDLPSSITYDRMYRFRNGNPKKDLSAYLYLTSKDRDGNTLDNAVGYAGDFRVDKDGNPISPKVVWCAKYDNGRTLTDDERRERAKAIKATTEKLNEELQKEQAKVAQDVRRLWETYSPVVDADHPYLIRKGIKPCDGIRQTIMDGQKCLVIPLRDAEGIQTLEYIGERNFTGTDRNKTLAKGGRAMGCWFQIGDGTPRFIAEGFATSVSIHQATGQAVVMAYSAGNLANVAGFFPKATIVADNDPTGKSKAEKASKEHGNPVVVIPIEGLDANDYATSGHDLKALLTPPKMFGRGGNLLMQGEPTQWLIRDWLPKGKSLLQLFGASGTGKTFVVLSWAMAIATGQPDWMGHKVKQGKVAYFCGEGLRGLSKRLAFWAQNNGGISALKSSLDSNFLYNVSPMPKLDDASQIEAIKEQLDAEKFRPDVIICDTLNRAMLGDENSTRDATAFIKGCDELTSRFDSALLLVHHTGWAVDAQHRSRGASAIPASLDMNFMLEAVGDALRLTQVKSKDGELQKPEYLKLQGGCIDGWFDEDGQPVRSAMIVRSDAPEESKTDRQISEEQLALGAFREYGYLNAEERVCISRDNLLKFLTGRLTDKKGLPLDKGRLQTEVNPNQSKFVGRLTKVYNLIETIWGARQTPLGFMLCAGEMADSVRNYLTQQNEIDF